MVKQEKIESYALNLLVSFDNPDDRYSLLIYADGSHIKYSFDAEWGSASLPTSDTDIYNRLETIGYHKIKSPCGWTELLKYPIKRGSFVFQKHETRDSIYIKTCSINYADIKASASYRFRKGLEWDCRFCLDTKDDRNFKVSITDSDGIDLVSSGVVLVNATLMISRSDKFLKLCRYSVYSYIVLSKLSGFLG